MGPPGYFSRASLYRRLLELKREREAAATRIPSDPVEFAVSVLDWRPFPYQEELLADESKRICVCAGRQTGKSTTVAVKACTSPSRGPTRGCSSWRRPSGRA